MIFEVSANGEVQELDLDQLAAAYSGIVNIGRKCEEVWNTIAIDDDSVDPFQCNLIGAVGGTWRLKHGQNRTECPKGLLSSKTVIGCCSNINFFVADFLDDESDCTIPAIQY